MKKLAAAALTAVTALALTGCSFQDVMLYLYGGDSFVKSDEPDYAQCDGGNGVTVVYDQNQWEQPVMAQDDTLSLTSGNQLRYDCGSYQTIFAQIDYDCGETVYVTAAARTSDYEPILDLLQDVWPTGHAPENAHTADTTTNAVTEEDVNGGRSKSLA